VGGSKWGFFVEIVGIEKSEKNSHPESTNGNNTHSAFTAF
jgi:hypothetical protein